VVAARDDVGAARLQLARDLGREPRAAGRVLAVHDREVDPELVAELRQERGDRVAARPADDVTDEQDAHCGYFA